MLGIKLSEPVLEVPHARDVNTFALLQGPEIPDVELHRKKLRFDLSARATDIAETACTRSPIKHLGFRHEPDTVALKQNSTEVLAVVIAQQLRVPRPRRFSHFTADEPRGRLHVKVLLHLADQPVGPNQIRPQRCRRKLRALRSIHELPPTSRQERARTRAPV